MSIPDGLVLLRPTGLFECVRNGVGDGHMLVTPHSDFVGVTLYMFTRNVITNWLSLSFCLDILLYRRVRGVVCE